MREGETVLCRSEEGKPRDGGCLLSLSVCRRVLQDLLKVRPSSLFMLCGCISSSVTSVMSRSMYPVFAERSFVPCSLIIWSWLVLCYATADLNKRISGSETQHQPGSVCSETSARKIRTPGYCPKERIQQSEHRVGWKIRIHL